MHDLYTSLTSTGAIFSRFIQFYAASSGKKLHSVRWCVTVVQDHSRSSKFVPVESPYAVSY